MDERTILNEIQRGNTNALETVIRMFSAYVITVIHNRARGSLSAEDEEELASDVFFSLWQNACRIEAGHIRPWLGRVAANKTVDLLRKTKKTVPLEDNMCEADDEIWLEVNRKEQAELLRQALNALPQLDREILFRHYDLCQTTETIAKELHMVSATVRTRLRRGRAALRDRLCQGGYVHED